MEFLPKINPSPLIIINPDAFEDFQSLKNKIILDSIVDSVSGMFLDALSEISTRMNFENPNLGTLISRLTQDIFSQFHLAEDSLNYYSFPINPQEFSPSKKKMISEKYTGSGYDLDTRGEEMRSYSYSGTTGSLMPKDFFVARSLPLWNELTTLLNLSQNVISFPSISSNPKLSSKYLKFLMFDKFWEKNNNDVFVIWEDNCYKGRFSNYKYTVSHTKPYEILYSFDLRVYPDCTYNYQTGWITDNDFKRMKNNSLNTSNFDFFRINTLLLPDETQENRDWFFTLGAYPYEKNKVNFSSNHLREFTNLNTLTPFELDQLYKINKDIDVFEDNVNFKLQNKMRNLSSITPNEEIQKSTGNETEIKKETNIIFSNPLNYIP